MPLITECTGAVRVEPPLNRYEVEYLTRFAHSPRRHRRKGPYYCSPDDFFRESARADYADVRHGRWRYGQPPGTCEWTPTPDGTAFVHTENPVRFTHGPEWMAYLIDTFVRPGARLQSEFPRRYTMHDGRYWAPEFTYFTFDHICQGVIRVKPEASDPYLLRVIANEVGREPVQ